MEELKMSKDEKTGIEYEEELDLTGLYCPEPLFEVRNYSETIEIDECFKVLADDPAAEEDLQRWAKRTGNVVLDLRKEGDVFTFIIQKKK
jgi:TusA-related sulfurtransferase